MQNGKRKVVEIDYRNSPVAWFSVLERARLDNDFELAAKAKRELARLGVAVSYKRNQSPRTGGAVLATAR